MVGERIGRYLLTGLVGRGGMGAVYEGLDERLGRRVAIKTLPVDSERDPLLVSRFVTEARATALIQHPSIVQIFDIEQLPDGRPYIVMEFVPGETVAARMLRAGPLSVPLALSIAEQVADALAVAHRYGVIHRDVKPSNLIVTGNDDDLRVKVLDFGIAKLRDDGGAGRLTGTGVMVGTPTYMSPEQIQGHKQVDGRSDQYSLGCVLFEMLVGRPPFEPGESTFDLMRAHVTDAPPALRALVPAASEALDTLLARLLSKRPEQRFDSTDQLVAALKALRLPGATPVGASTTQVIPRFPSLADAAGQQWFLFEEKLPTILAPMAPLFRDFLQPFFGRIEHLAQALFRLGDVKLPEAEGYEYFALFMTVAGPEAGHEPSAGGRLGTRTFIAYARPLEERLAAMSPEQRKVVIVVADSQEMGRGVRETIFEYRRKYDAVVVPVYVGELARARRQNNLDRLFHDRLVDLHSAQDPFARHAPATDPTRFFGMKDVLNGLVADLKGRAGLAVISGAPGSGKTSLLNMAEYELATHRFLRFRCAGYESFAALRAAFEATVARVESDGAPLVIALEDADWLVSQLGSHGTSEGDRTLVRAMWMDLLRRCTENAVRVVVCGVRGFRLKARIVAGWENPLAGETRVWQVPRLDRPAVERLLRELGAEENVRFEPAAMSEVYASTAGSVGLVRKLASEALRVHRRHSTSHPLAVVWISERQVRSAARDLAAVASTFADDFLPWLNRTERDVLRVVAGVRPASPEALRRRLADSCPGEEVRDATETLRQIGLVERRDGRDRVAIPLLETWIRRNLDDPTASLVGDRRLRAAGTGLAITTLLVGLYLTFIRSGTAVSDPVRLGTCSFWLQHPRRAAERDQVQLYFRQDCASAELLGRLRIESGPATVVRFGDLLATAEPRRFCAAETACPVVEIPATLVSSATDDFELDVTENALPIARIRIAKDRFASTKAMLDGAFKYAAGLPLALGLVLGFFRDTQAKIRSIAKLARAGRQARRSPASS